MSVFCSALGLASRKLQTKKKQIRINMELEYWSIAQSFTLSIRGKILEWGMTSKYKHCLKKDNKALCSQRCIIICEGKLGSMGRLSVGRVVHHPQLNPWCCQRMSRLYHSQDSDTGKLKPCPTTKDSCQTKIQLRKLSWKKMFQCQEPPWACSRTNSNPVLWPLCPMPKVS